MGSSPLARGLPTYTKRTISLFRIIPARAGFTTETAQTSHRKRDHPRSRGVYDLGDGGCVHCHGSSPLARGLQQRRRRRVTGSGIIPARAGFTIWATVAAFIVMDHPRSRGVYEKEAHRLRVQVGSSPLARGLRRQGQGQRELLRIIPARAGFTAKQRARDAYKRDHPRSRGVYRRAPRPSRSLSDHPRSRGVYAGLIGQDAGTSGSSPLARGLLGAASDKGKTGRIIPARAGFTRQRSWQARSIGIIPARAGFTPSNAPATRTRADHPRSRGVYLFLVVVHPLAERIIPARAGFTSRRESGNRTRRDHPRSRGVYLNWTAAGLKGKGSSPLARGLHAQGHFIGITAGIIPARAGFTSSMDGTIWSVPDHPRSRGVYRILSPHFVGARGSSPLARGLLAYYG